MLNIEKMYSNYLKLSIIKSLTPCPFCDGIDLFYISLHHTTAQQPLTFKI